MQTSDRLKAVEKRAYRSTFEDGIYDIVLGIMLLVFSVIPVMEMLGLNRFYAYPLFIVLPLVSLVGKKYITVPRLGAVEFGPKRKTRARLLGWIFAAALFLMAPVVIMVFAGGMQEGARTASTLWILAGSAALPLLTMAAFFMDFPRMYIYLAVVSGAVVEVEFVSPVIGKIPGCIVAFGLPGLVITIYGILLFSRFVKKYPVPGKEALDVR